MNQGGHLMKKGLYILSNYGYNNIYGPEQRAEIEALLDIYAPPQTGESIRENLDLLKDAEVIMSGWGGPKMDEEFLNAAPNLKAVFYGAGTVRHVVTDEFWKRNIILTSAYAANAIPVAEFCLAQILFSLKHGWKYLLQAKATKNWPQREVMPGAFRSTVGLITLGMIGRKTLELLQPYDINVMAQSRSLTDDEAQELGIRNSTIEEIFAQADVISLHTPDLPATRGMITGEHFEMMKPGATFINTARGRVVRQDEMIEVLKKRPDIYACLDVTYPEPPPEGSALYELPNVVLTPHIAGSWSKECNRMGQYAADELKLYCEGTPQKWLITEELSKSLA